MRKLGIKRWSPSEQAKRVIDVVERVLRLLKYVVLAGICAAVYLGFSEFLNDNSPWVAFAQLTNLSARRLTILGVALLLVISVGSIVKERFFCEFLCPMGALLTLVPTLRFGRMRRDDERCRKGCHACRKGCPVDIEPHGPHGHLLAGECLMCGRCADVCPAENARNGLDATLAARDERKAGQTSASQGTQSTPGAQGATDVQGTQSAQGIPGRGQGRRAVIAFAVALLFLVVFWLTGAARFLPTLPM